MACDSPRVCVLCPQTFGERYNRALFFELLLIFFAAKSDRACSPWSKDHQMTHCRIIDKVSSHCLCMFQRKRWRNLQEMTSAGKNEQKLMHDESKRVREGEGGWEKHPTACWSSPRCLVLLCLDTFFWRWTMDRITQFHSVSLLCETIDDPISCGEVWNENEKDRQGRKNHGSLACLLSSLGFICLFICISSSSSPLSILHSLLQQVPCPCVFLRIWSYPKSGVGLNEWI